MRAEIAWEREREVAIFGELERERGVLVKEKREREMVQVCNNYEVCNLKEEWGLVAV